MSQEVAAPTTLVHSAYVHIPFCAHKCGYCDFASVAGAEGLADRYLDALEREFALRLRSPQAVETIFVGGGTPTRLSANQLDRCLSLIGKWMPLRSGGEWTVEANPGSIDARKIAILADRGVNRISLGAQSFQTDLLAVLERNHNPDDVTRAVELLEPRFDRWSLDLIFGVPGSSLDQWREDIQRALALNPPHLSAYGLVFEKGTPLWKAREAGTVRSLDEEIERFMYEETIDRLAEVGLVQYEISNFARPGYECAHNLVYWRNAPCHGFGLGAARFLEGERAVNTRDLNSYLKRIEAGGDPTGPRERLEPEAHARETLVVMLRRTLEGVDRDDFRARTGFDLSSLCGATIERWVARGLLHDDGRRVSLSREGVFLADTVLSSLV